MIEELSIGGHTYRIGAKKINAMEQFHITRRLGPALIVAGFTFQALMEGAKVGIEDWIAVAGPVMDVVGHMSNEDVEYVILTSMKAAERMSGGSWAPVLAPDGKTLMFQDMDQTELIQITVAVLRGSLGNFFTGLNVGGNTSEGSVTDQPQKDSSPQP